MARASHDRGDWRRHKPLLSVAVVLSGVLAWALWWTGLDDAVERERAAAVAAGHSELWERAEARAREGLAMLEVGRGDEARERIRQAVGVLYNGGLLDDVERRRALEVGVERLEARLGVETDLAGRFRALEAGARPEQGSVRPCRLDSPGTPQRACAEEGIVWLLAELRQANSSVPPPFVDEVVRTLALEREFIAKSLGRGDGFVPMMKRELEARRMPPLLHYVALIESGYRADARSHAGALGMWQFMPATATSYGLRVSEALDERLDPERSTRAAAAYLQDLAFEFGGDSLFLALASYNYGQNRVRSALRTLDDPFSERSYWRLVELGLLPQETARYVARFMAAALGGELGLPTQAVIDR